MGGSPDPTDRLSARTVAFEILERVERGGAFASVLLERREAHLEDPREAALAHELVLGVLRRRAGLDHALDAVIRRPVAAVDGDVRTVLRIGAYSLLYLERIPAFAAVDSAVRSIRGSRPAAAGFVNGVLRAVVRRGRALLPARPRRGDVEGLALFHSHPAWWVRRVVGRRGWEEAERLLASQNRPAATVLRANPARTTLPELGRILAAAGIETRPCRFARGALRVVSGDPRATSSVLAAGLAWIQDEAAQLVTEMFPGRLGPRVADLCAAPGGKTLQLAARLVEEGRVVAVDRHPARMRRLAENVTRVGASGVLPVVADLRPGHAALRGAFREVLVDAPCTGTGTLRRHPEIRWRLDEDGPKLLAVRQLELLEMAASVTERGGRIVYSVCSLEPEEGEAVVDEFLAAHPDFALEDPRQALPPAARVLVRGPGYLSTSPLVEGMDGFFAARLGRGQTR